jgi:glycosyltransferase involved in cell wall biosynthesis
MYRYASVAFDEQIWKRQRRGGISRYFEALSSGLAREGVKVLHANRKGLSKANIVHATYYGGRPYRLRSDQGLVSSLFDMTPERYPEHFVRIGGLRSPHANKYGWFAASDEIFSISHSSADDLSFFMPRLQANVRVIPLATDIDELTTKPISGLLGRRFWLLVGKRHGYKNALTLLRALKLIGNKLRSHEHPLLVFTGGEPLGRQEKKLLCMHGLTPWVIHIEADDNELAWLYRNTEAVFVPSLAEGFSLPLIESLACNSPVFASDLEVHREVAGLYATLLPAVNTVAWAEALDSCLVSPPPRPSVQLGNVWKELRGFYALPRLLSEHQRAYNNLACSKREIK